MRVYVLILIVASNALTKLSAFAACTVTLAIFLETPTLLALAAFHSRTDFLHLFSIFPVNVLFFCVFASLAATDLGITNLTCSKTVTVIFLAPRVFASATFSIGIDRLENVLFLRLRFLNFHVTNGKRKFFLHGF